MTPFFVKWLIVKAKKSSAKEEKELDSFHSWSWAAPIYLDVQKTL